ncbi:MAG: hypothetical protein EZS28_003571 [Streblomastix strix]|uniref:Uncharacterized protein n=1 Tax=Streblomastix strix TaxID=222440 RepID=A0A5J4X353_9EUKA|nr:MAG: hypothetical protein EZS28_003571 [Streblomastix strix]
MCSQITARGSLPYMWIKVDNSLLAPCVQQIIHSHTPREASPAINTSRNRMSASIQKVNLEHNQDIDVVQNIMSQEPTQKLDFEELGHIVHLLHSDNEIMQAQHIRSLIEIICKELRQGFFNEIIDFIDNEGLIDILLTHVSHKYKELRTIRDVLLHIVDVIPRYGPSQIDEKESIEFENPKKFTINEQISTDIEVEFHLEHKTINESQENQLNAIRRINKYFHITRTGVRS